MKIILKIIIISTTLIFLSTNLAYANTTNDTNLLLLDKAIKAKNAHNYQEAIKDFDQVLENDPKNTIALNGKGGSLALIGNTTQAMKYFDQVLEINPNDVNGLNNKASMFMILGNYTTASQYLNKSLTINSQNLKTLNLESSLLGKTGRYNDSMSYSDKILSLDPKNIDALNNKGLALLQIGNVNQSIPYFDKILGVDENNTNALNNKGAALWKLKNFTGALYYFSRVIDVDPKNITPIIKNEVAVFNTIGLKDIENSKFSHSYLELEVRNSKGWLVSYIETKRIAFLDSNLLDKVLDDYAEKQIITINGQKFEEYKITQKVDYAGSSFAAKTTYYAENKYMSIIFLIASQPSYTFEQGDHGIVKWFMIKSI
jgi:tetratricopeptide (TPR) repeat protein